MGANWSTETKIKQEVKKMLDEHHKAMLLSLKNIIDENSNKLNTTLKDTNDNTMKELEKMHEEQMKAILEIKHELLEVLSLSNF